MQIDSDDAIKISIDQSVIELWGVKSDEIEEMGKICLINNWRFKRKKMCVCVNESKIKILGK